MRRDRRGCIACLLALAAGTGCLALPGHRCDPALGHAQCGDKGVCEPEGACSFPDGSCMSGRAFGSETPPALAGQCVQRDPCNGSASATVQLEAVQNASTKGSEPDTVIDTATVLRVDPNDSLTCFGSGQPQFGLLQFDLLPFEGATIVRADLQFSSDETLSGNLLVAPILESWVEGHVTWNDRDTGLAWAIPGPRDPGSVGLAWVDHGPVPAAGRIDFSLATNPQPWIDDPPSNHGLVLQVEDTPCDGINIASRTAPDAATRPVLQVMLSCF